MSDLWANLDIPKDLAPLITLSGSDVADLSAQAMQAADPKVKLRELLIARGEEKKLAIARHNVQRMAEDKAMVLASHKWPHPYLRMKSQPWITNLNGVMKFGQVHHTDKLTLIPDHGDVITFETVDDLVQWWSVD